MNSKQNNVTMCNREAKMYASLIFCHRIKANALSGGITIFKEEC